MLGRIQVPTLVLCGAHDMIRPADSRAIAAAIPGARLQELPHEGHGTYIVHSPKLAHLVLAFLRSWEVPPCLRREWIRIAIDFRHKTAAIGFWSMAAVF